MIGKGLFLLPSDELSARTTVLSIRRESPSGPTRSYPHVGFDDGFRRESGLVVLTSSFVKVDPYATSGDRERAG